MTTGNSVAEKIIEGLEQFAENLQRERFEEWRVAHCDDRDDLRRDLNGDYVDSHTRMMWLAWRAALTWKATK